MDNDEMEVKGKKKKNEKTLLGDTDNPALGHTHMGAHVSLTESYDPTTDMDKQMSALYRLIFTRSI